ncbi:MAG: carboxypeptidase M32 [Endozoicomonas sp.]
MNQAYNHLVERFKKLHRLHHLGSLAQWDQAAMMPAGGNQARSEALAELSSLTHELLTAPEVGNWLDEASQVEHDEFTGASIREMKTRWRNASVIPSELVKARSLASSKCEHAWRTQRPENDWQGFSRNLEEVLKLVQEEATIRSEAAGISGYDALLDLYEPGMSSASLDELFSDVKSWLPDLIQKTTEQQQGEQVLTPEGPFPIEQQKALGQSVMELLGFDFHRGRLDISVHPFCGGVPEDVRLTTRYKESDFVEALMGTIHETGHARYEQNRPRQLLGLPVGEHRSMGIHESQSLLFEMQLGRSPAFLSLLRPLIIQHLGNGQEQTAFSQQNLEKIYSRVRPGLIRVEADEITYPAHIILRYEVEKSLVEGDMAVSDIPDAWNEKMQAYLGLSTEGDFSNGCMQDIHWPMASFGYFPSYTLGAMYAAQQFAAVKRQMPDVESMIRNGKLAPIFDWLQNNIWEQGCRYETAELVSKATGEPLNARYFREHLEQRYLGA